MNRAETTRFLGELLKSDRFRGMGKYWASEVSVDAFTAAGKGGRVDCLPELVPQEDNLKIYGTAPSRNPTLTATAGMRILTFG